MLHTVVVGWMICANEFGVAHASQAAAAARRMYDLWFIGWDPVTVSEKFPGCNRPDEEVFWARYPEVVGPPSPCRAAARQALRPPPSAGALCVALRGRRGRGWFRLASAESKPGLRRAEAASAAQAGEVEQPQFMAMAPTRVQRCRLQLP